MIKSLILNDFKYLKKDPMYMMVFILPIILGCIYNGLVLKIDFLKPYNFAVQYLLLCLAPLMVGMVLGFRVLDEKDERVISVYAVSPLGIKGYMTYRIIQCVILSIFNLIVLALFNIIPKYNYLLDMIICILLALIIFLLLSLIGQNKIQGMTISKLIGVFVMLPGLQIIAQNKWDIFFKMIPTNFILTSTLMENKFYMGFVYIFSLLIVILLMLKCFYSKFIKN